MLNTVLVTPTSASFELINSDCFKTDPYVVYLNGKKIIENDKNVFSIYDLTPNTSYSLKLVQKGKEETISFSTENKERVVYKNDNLSANDDATKEIQLALDNLRANQYLEIQGTYKVVSLFLKSYMTIYLPKGSSLLGETDRNKFPIFHADSYSSGIPLGTWEGRVDDCYASIINGIGVSHITIYGQGVIDCQAQNSDFWINHRVKRGARRPKGIFLHTCSDVVFQGISVKNTPSWNQHPFYSKNLIYCDCTYISPEDSPNTDGIDPESCDNVKILGCYISDGDDCIAVKSGKYELAQKYKTPCSNIIIRNCYMEKGHGGVTLGSENSGGINHLQVSNCIFTHTDRGLRIKSQRSRGNLAIISDISFNNIKMDDVKAPLVINAFYKAGNDEIDYRFDRDYREFDSLTPVFKNFAFSNMELKDVSYGVGYFLGLPESKLAEVKVEDITVTYKKDAVKGEMAMTKEHEEFLKIGFYVSNVTKLIIKNVKFLDEPSQKYIIDNVDSIVEE